MLVNGDDAIESLTSCACGLRSVARYLPEIANGVDHRLTVCDRDNILDTHPPLLTEVLCVYVDRTHMQLSLSEVRIVSDR